jgi:hypothetical protein
MKNMLRAVVVLFAGLLALPPGASAGTDPAEFTYDVVVTFLELTTPATDSMEVELVPGTPSYRVLSVMTAKEISGAEAEALSLRISEAGFVYRSHATRRRVPAHRVQFVDVARHRY